MEPGETRRCIFCMTPLQEGSNRCPQCKKAPWEYGVQKDCLPPETVLHGRYGLGALLGAGGFGHTYIGWDNLLNKAVAIKEYAPRGLYQRDSEGTLVPLEENAFQQGREDFWREAQTVYARFDVPGICPVLECFEERGTAYIVEEYMAGGTLRELLEKRPGHRLAYEEVLTLFAPVLEGLSLLHSEGILHMDISPDNLMVDGEGTLRLIDFGSARGKGEGGKPTAKYTYAAPEQLGTGGVVGPWSDIYALCAVLYETISGERPAPALSRMHRESLAPLSRWAQLPPEGEAAILQGLGLDIQSRFFALFPLMERLGLEAGKEKATLDAHRRQWGEAWLEAVSSPTLLKKRSRRGLTGLQKRRIGLILGTVVLGLGLLFGGLALFEHTHPETVLQWRLEQAYKKGRPQRTPILEGTELYDQIMESLEEYEKNESGTYEVDKKWVEKMGVASNDCACFPIKESLGKKVLEVTLDVKLEENERSSFYGSVYTKSISKNYLVVNVNYSGTWEMKTGEISWSRDAATGYIRSLGLDTTDRELAKRFLTKTFHCFVPETYFTEEEAEELLNQMEDEDSTTLITHHSRFFLSGSYRETSGWSIWLYPEDSLQTSYGY